MKLAEATFHKNLSLLSAQIPLIGHYFSLPEEEEEDEEDFHSFSEDIDQKKIIYAYGLGTASIYEMLIPWLRKNPHRKLYCIEDRLGRLRKFLSREIATAFLEDSQTEIAFVRDQPQQVFNKWAWENLMVPYHTCILSSYEKNPLSALRYQKLLNAHLAAHLIFSDVKDFGLKVFQNIKSLRENCLLIEDLKGGFKGLPAVLCGAGPSLERELPFLKKIREKALILAGGNAARILSKAGVEPHFIVNLDPDASAESFKECHFFQTPLIFLSRCSSEVVSSFQGPKILVPHGEGQALESYLFQGLPSLEGGWTVANFCASLAVHFGCGPILFTGMDFSYPEGKKYCGDSPSEEFRNGSRPDLLMSRQWMESFCAEREILFHSGKSLTEIFSAFPCYDFDAHVHRLLMEQEAFSLDEVHVRVKELEESLERAERLLENFFNLEGGEEKIKRERWILEADLEAEICHSVLFKPLWEIWKWVLGREPGEMQKELFFWNVGRAYGKKSF